MARFRPYSPWLARILEEKNRAGELQQELHHDPTDNTFTVRTMQDVEPILKRNMELQIHGGHTVGPAGMYGPPTGDMKLVASIPPLEVHRLLHLGIKVWDPEAWPWLRKYLNDPSNVRLRTSAGRV